MSQLSRGQLAVYAAAAIAIALIGARYLRESHQPASRGADAPRSRPVPIRVTGGGGAEADGWATVQVAGEVRRPGVFRVRAGGRVDDAVRQAGGLTRRADLTGVNLAAKVEDGKQVIVPVRGAAAATAAPAGAAGATGASAPGAGGAAPGTPLNLNTATLEQLDQLDGVGPATARKIVGYRQQHGGFRSIDELDQVPGIGPKRLAALRALLRV
jgi:competence protein ComEA